MIIVTGAAGFIGSCLIEFLNRKGHNRDIIVVDDFYKSYKEANLEGKFIRDWIHRDIFVEWFQKNHKQVDFVFHIGARTDTTEQSQLVFDRLNVQYSQALAEICCQNNIPFIYASSAACYGDGAHGYNDDHKLVSKLQALNPYGKSKLEFDQWFLKQKTHPDFWAGFRFFNVFGPNEYHKKRMASVCFHGFNQIKNNRKIHLFRSHRDDYQNGEQCRDFVYVKDVLEVLYYFFENRKNPGIYNLGSGKARSFNDLATSIFDSMNIKPSIKYIDTPEDIRGSYQYFTEADISKLREAGYQKEMTVLEDGVRDYVKNYLVPHKYY